MLCYWVIDRKGDVFSCTTVQHITEQDLQSDDICKQFEQLDSSLNECLNDHNFISSDATNMLYEEDSEDRFNEVDEGIDNPEPINESGLAGKIEEGTNVYDEYLGAELIFDVGPDGAPRKGIVVKQLRGADRCPIKQGHHNPLLDTHKYEVEVKRIPQEFTANMIAENLYSQVDSEGQRELIYKAIINHKKDTTVIDITNRSNTTRGGQTQPIITTKGWQLKLSGQMGLLPGYL